MKNKNNVYVEIESKEQAEIYRKVLEAMGEPVSLNFYKNKENKMVFYSEEWLCGYWNVLTEEKITFSDLIDLLQRKPLFKTTNGVDIFKGDTFYWVTKLPDRYCNPIQSVMYGNIPESDLFTFDTNDAALEWIESHKPKSIRVKLWSGHTASVTEGGVVIPVQAIKHSDIEEIYAAIKEIQNG